MPLKNLTKEEQSAVVECLVASANGPFFDDDDFHILFGMHRNELLKIIDNLSHIDDTDEVTIRAINNSIINLMGFPHNKEKHWDKYISVPPAELERIFEKWKEQCRSS
jgi:hypothetical protein